MHTPEFAFEHVASNVSGAIKRLGVRYPVVQDNDFKIWNAYSNQYWPAEYLIDRPAARPARALRRGRVRPDGETDPQAARRRPGLDDASVADTTPQHPMTPESYLGWERLQRFVGDQARCPAAW